MNASLVRNTLLALALAVGTGSVTAQDSTEDLIKRLKGQSGKTEQSESKFKTRGLGTRGLNTPTAKVKTETRSLKFSTRGIPTAIKAAAEEDKVKLDYTSSNEVEVKYNVDPESKVTKTNILFKKGSAEFADYNSFQVVSQLATAMKSSDLASLKFVVEGHASAEGSEYANLTLSQQRAEYIVTVLAQQGVSPTRLLPIGYGESQARYNEYSAEHLLAQDRRVLIYRLEQ